MIGKDLPTPDTITGRWAERGAFLRQAIRDPRSIGAVLPSGNALAAALAEPVRAGGPRPKSILEVGAGTGSVTRALIDAAPRASRLDIIEANRGFAARVGRLVDAHPLPRERAVQTTVHQTLLERYDTDHRYDVIVSGLPLTNFEPLQVAKIMARLMALLHPGGTLTYIAYLGTRTARRLLASPAESRRHDAVDQVMHTYRREYATSCRTIWANVPPARVWRLQRPAQDHRTRASCTPTGLRTEPVR
ncbi:class I SAM-dependent methyltransferase [Dactylosporangium sp. CA-233914]|uniref:class I SAM-dependent methyltransferase n=1 Tax=Dactylosporangium sp. CA-233914 TaxID=3239934 RepID=UPI003D91F106